VEQLKLNADQLVMSACNEASAEKPGVEAPSALARAFFHAGARSLRPFGRTFAEGSAGPGQLSNGAMDFSVWSGHHY
jgi:hypothetical protein